MLLFAQQIKSFSLALPRMRTLRLFATLMLIHLQSESHKCAHMMNRKIIWKNIFCSWKIKQKIQVEVQQLRGSSLSRIGTLQQEWNEECSSLYTSHRAGTMSSIMSDRRCSVYHYCFVSFPLGLRNAFLLGNKWDWRAVSQLSLPSSSRRLVASRRQGSLLKLRQAKPEIAQLSRLLIPLLVHPSPVTNCSVSNHSREMAEVQCTSGYDGNLPQIFLLEILSRRTKAIK